MAVNKAIQVEVSSEPPDLVAYITLPDHPGRAPGIVGKHIRLRDLIGAYVGPDLVFDFDHSNRLIGIEVLE